MNDSLLRIEDVSRQFPGDVPTHALRNVNLTVDEGDFVAIEGASGGGKSTLLNIIGLLDEPTTGRYIVDGSEPAALSESARARIRSDTFAFIFQSFHLLDRRPVIDSVELPLVYRKVPTQERRRLAREALRMVGLHDKAWQIPAKLSGGERQRVAIARAITAQAPIVLADEPTGNLDTHNSALVVDSLQRLNQTGVTIVLITHSADVAQAACRRVHISDGELRDTAGVALPTHSVETTREPPARPAPPGVPSRVRFSDLIRDAAVSVSSRLGRTAGLVAAVAVGVALAIATIGLSLTANAQVSDTFNAHTNRDVTVTWRPDTSSPADVAAITPNAAARDLSALNGVSAAGVITSFGQQTAQSSLVGPIVQTNAYTMTDKAPKAGRMSVTWAGSHLHTLATGEVVVGSTLAKQLSLGPLALSPVVYLDSLPRTVVGIITDSPRMPELLSSLVGAAVDESAYGYVSQRTALALTDIGAAHLVASQAALALDPFNPGSLKVTAPVDPSAVRDQIEGQVQTTLFALSGVALLASIAGLGNSMALSVMERRAEFGLRRAIGARPHHIASLVLCESVIIGALGGVVGLVLGMASTLVITVLRRWGPVLDLRLIPAAIVAGMIVGAIGGLLASARATRIQPHAALRL